MSWLSTFCFPNPYHSLQDHDLQESDCGGGEEKEARDPLTVLPSELVLLLFDEWLTCQDLIACVQVCTEWNSRITQSSVQYRAWSRVLQPMAECVGTNMALSSAMPLLALLLACRRGDLAVCNWLYRRYNRAVIPPEDRFTYNTLLMDCLQTAYYKRHYAVCSWLATRFQLNECSLFQNHEYKLAYAYNAALLQRVRNCSESMLPELARVDLLEEIRSAHPAHGTLTDKKAHRRRYNALLLLLRLYGRELYEEYEHCIQGYCDKWQNAEELYCAAVARGDIEVCDRLLQLILKKHCSGTRSFAKTALLLRQHREYRACACLIKNAYYLRQNVEGICAHFMAILYGCSLACREDLVAAHARECADRLPTHSCCVTFCHMLRNERTTLPSVSWFYQTYGALLQQSDQCYCAWDGSEEELPYELWGKYNCVDIFFMTSYCHASADIIQYIHEIFQPPVHCRHTLLYVALYTSQKQAASLLLPMVLADHRFVHKTAFLWAARSKNSAMLRWLMRELEPEHVLCLTLYDLYTGLQCITDYSLWTQTLQLLLQRPDFHYNDPRFHELLVLLSHSHSHRQQKQLLAVLYTKYKANESLWSSMTRTIRHYSRSSAAPFVRNLSDQEMCEDMIHYPEVYLEITFYHATAHLYATHKVDNTATDCPTLRVSDAFAQKIEGDDDAL